jgi:hypothetical protein
VSLSSAGISGVQIPSLVVGIDETATETQLTEGWSFFLLPAGAVANFATAGKAILAKAEISAFHGKKFRVRDADAYLQFLRLIRLQLQTHTPSILICSLMNEKWKGTFVPFAENLLQTAIAGASLHDLALFRILKTMVAPLLTLQRLTRGCSEPASIRIEIDADDIKRNFVHSRVAVRNATIHASVPPRGVYNGYRKRRFPKSSELERDSIDVVDDNDSILIQAADVFGNFSFGGFVELGVRSKLRLKKSELLASAFGDILEPIDYQAKCRLRGADLELLTDGTLNSTVSTGL